MIKLAIKNGITLSIIPDQRFKTFSVGMYVHLPLSWETAAQNALLPMVQKSGSKNYSDSAAINRRLDYLYGARLGAVSLKQGEVHTISYTLNALSDKFAPGGEKVEESAVNLLADIALNPLYGNGAFIKPHVDREKRALNDIIEGQMNDKRRYALIRLIDMMCESEAYGVRQYGRAEDLEGIDGEVLKRHYESVMENAPISIIITGNIEPEKAKELAQQLVSSLAPREGEYPPTDAVYLDNQIRYVNEEMDVAQGKLAIGCRTGIGAESEEYFSLLVANEIFGGSPASKLFNNVRERLSLCYYISSSLERMKGLMFISAGIEASNRQRAIHEIFAEARNMAEGKITREELAAAKASLINNYRSYGDDVDMLLAFYASQLGLSNVLTPLEAAARIERVTMDDVIAAAKRLRFDTVYFLGKGGGEE